MKNNLVYGSKPGLLILTCIIFCVSSDAQWSRKADALQYRSDLSESVVYKSRLYTFLGFYDRERHADSTSEVYDPATDTYTLLAPLPGEPVTHQKVILIDNTVWLIGGRLGQNPGPLTSKIWIYNITNDSWSQGPELRDPATGDPLLWAAGGAALLGRTLHLFGGFIINGCHHDQSKYHLTLDIDTWLSDTTKPAEWENDLAPLPIKRNHFSTVVLGGKIYAIGGQFDHDCGGLEQRYSHVYDPATDQWTELPLLPEARSHAEGSSFAIDGKIYLAGGQGEDGTSTDKVTIFDPAGNGGAGSWADDSSLTLPARIEGGTAKVINSTFIFSHGGGGTSRHPLKKTFTTEIIRNPVHKFGFSSGCLSINADSGTSVESKTLLFTIDSSKGYTATSNTDWLVISKNASGTATQNGVDILLSINTAGLSPGNYEGFITANSSGSGPKFTGATFCVHLTVTGVYPNVQKLEAEKARLRGVEVSSDHAGFSGTGFGDYVHVRGDYIEWTVDKKTAGSARLSFRYSNGNNSDRPLHLSVNGVVTHRLSFPSTGTWDNWTTITVTGNLKDGANTIRLTAIGDSGPNIDYMGYAGSRSATAVQTLSLERSVVIPSHDLSKAQVFPNPASREAELIVTDYPATSLIGEICDITGRKYKKLKLFNVSFNSFRFFVNDIPSGMYIIRITQGNITKTLPFVVSHKN